MLQIFFSYLKMHAGGMGPTPSIRFYQIWMGQYNRIWQALVINNRQTFIYHLLYFHTYAYGSAVKDCKMSQRNWKPAFIGVWCDS
jgi:hypothetical protein